MSAPRHARDPEVEVAMRLMASRRDLIAAIGEATYRARVAECREAIEREAPRHGGDHREAALAISERVHRKADTAANRVIATLVLIVGMLEMPAPAELQASREAGA